MLKKIQLTRTATSSSFHDLYNEHDARDAVVDDHDRDHMIWSVSVHKVRHPRALSAHVFVLLLSHLFLLFRPLC